MSNFPWIILIVLLLLGLLLILYFAVKQKKSHPPDYYALFILGITWLGAGAALGITTKNYGLFGAGVIFTIIGLANKKKWKQNHRTWKDLDSAEKKIKLTVIVLLGLFVLAGLIFYILY